MVCIFGYGNTPPCVLIQLQNKSKGVIQMENSRFRKQRLRKLNKGKRKRLGFWETVMLKLTGYRDGKKGLPRVIDDNVWYSPFMNREVNSYEEFCSHTWGGLQIENEERYAELKELTDVIQQKKIQLEVAKEKLMIAYQDAKNSEVFRKNGEDKLTDSQVRARRNFEKEKRLVPEKKKVSDLEHELKKVEKSFFNLYSKLVEDSNTTRLICQRVKEHTHMRVDMYWNSMLIYHPDGMTIPAVPVLNLRNDAEEEYFRLHRDLMTQVAAIRKDVYEKEGA